MSESVTLDYQAQIDELARLRDEVSRLLVSADQQVMLAYLDRKLVELRARPSVTFRGGGE